VFLGLLAPVLGAALGYLVAATGSGQSAAGAWPYAIGATPHAALFGALAARLDGPPVSRSLGVAGALLALAAALVTALVMATIRFRLAGATGLVAPAALVATQEFHLLAGLLPALALVGWRLGTTRRKALALPASGAVGIAGAVAAGPSLILTAAVGRVLPLSPPLLALLFVALVVIASWPRRA
ncbi:MAG: hypothetical protein AB7L66_05500, partial [Gemmatimonadales bacterium]